MRYFILAIICFTLVACKKDTNENSVGNCETVVNANGPGYLKVINELDSRISVFLPEYAFEAIVNANKCEIYGLNLGTRKAEISLCASYDCDNYSQTKNISFVIEEGETHLITVDKDYFK